MTRPNFSLQPLESRRLLSASTVDVHDECPEVTDARQELHELVVEFARDRRAGRAALAEIRADIHQVLAQLYEEKGDEIQEALAPLRQELREAFESQSEQRRSVLGEMHEVREKWSPVIAEDVQAVLDARAAGDEDAAKAAMDKLIADRNAMKAELLPLKQQLEEVMQQTRAEIAEIRQRIDDTLASFSDELKELLEQLRVKAQEVHDELTADHAAVVAAEQRLRDAIAACREEHAGDRALA